MGPCADRAHAVEADVDGLLGFHFAARAGVADQPDEESEIDVARADSAGGLNALASPGRDRLGQGKPLGFAQVGRGNADRRQAGFVPGRV